ncbi:regulatory protein, Fis family [Oceanospirillum multiglobuliferum]|uniref:Sigma-54-dependent Fis family transcriptional regulator n=1 Tax=Oceanospirillum multiglobuliferum TaxID=64969 RepID=A0A1T4RUM4_9GAMM|nr:sigma-54-dependent Fis family transcriptional regulator [Oceanospirillum multiglobuliferum]OPX54616.1 sigma-54-dependent Fis family transcriptional regulator [Oceanospirillum multiglobuliferum]SKA19704.1 regulatory protein, Fis family [Oceanospirillum multiglobuliferum]
MQQPTQHLTLPSRQDLLDQLRFDPENGKIWLAEHRSLLLGISAMGSFRKEIISTMGQARAKGFFMRLGYYSGLKDAELALQVRPNSTPEEAFLTGPQLHCLRGMVKAIPICLEMDVANQHFYAEFDWEDSFEVEICQTVLGQLEEPACWILLGYACSYSSQFLGQEIQFREVECRGKGDHRCHIIGKPAHEWEDHESFRELFREAPLIDELYALQSQIAALEERLPPSPDTPTTIGSAPPFTSALQMIDKGSDSDVTMLLLGETGTGKEVLARRIHSMSPRRDQPFIAVNCAAIPPELIESELFGVQKGAFTGATQNRIGRFERAHQGTIFLDEVIELTPRAQAALLRVLQEGELERVGDSVLRKIDVRVVAATNENLAQAVAEGRFRADLFYRINAYTVIIPPLRERKNDIPLLAEHFRKRYEARYKKKSLGLTDRAMAALVAYDWPGNIRELENTIERGVILTDNHQSISEQSLFHYHSPFKQAIPETSQQQLNDQSGRLESVQSALPSATELIAQQVLNQEIDLNQLEEAILRAAMSQHDNNVSKAARALGLTRPALAYRLKNRLSDKT